MRLRIRLIRAQVAFESAARAESPEAGSDLIEKRERQRGIQQPAFLGERISVRFLFEIGFEGKCMRAISGPYHGVVADTHTHLPLPFVAVTVLPSESVTVSVPDP
jgi:hypothetical protein